MKSIIPALPLAAVLSLAACAGNTNRPTDTGNMQFPAPRATGAISEPGRTSPDVGNMQAPAPSGGLVGRPTTGPGPDTGSMALPNRAQGNSTH